MSETTAPRPEAEQRAVHRLLEAVIRNDRVIAFLKQRGIEPVSESERPAPSEQVPTGPAADMLLNIAAALRLRSWERAGLKPRLPAELPSAADALAAAADCATSPPRGEDALAPIPREVFRVLLERFALEGQADVGADVVLDTEGSGDDFLDQFAAFLFTASQITNQVRKERAEDGGTSQEPH